MKTAVKYFQRLPVSSLLLLFLTFLTLFLSYFHVINAITQDLGRHLLTGKIILSTFSVPSTNLYSYTYPDHPFINHHWLSEVLFYFFYSLGGFTLLLFVMTILVLFAFVLLFKKAGSVASIPVMITVSILLFRVLFERTDLRPELFSFFFFSTTLVLLYTFRERFTRLIFLIPLIQLFWINMHIYFFVGLFVIALFLFEQILLSRKQLVNQKNKVLTLVFLLSCLVSLLNPNGISGALYPLLVFKNYGYTIEENQTIFFLQSFFPKPTIVYFEISVVLLFILLILSWKKTRLIDWLLTISFTILGGLAIRNFPLFVIATFIPFCLSLSNVIDRIQGSLSQKNRSLLRFSCLFIIVILLLLQIRDSANRFPITPRLEKGGEGAVTYFLKNNLPGPIFNNFDIGSYLIFSLYPKEKVFVDGRPEAYPASFFHEIYIPMQQNKAIFQQVEKYYGFQTIIFSHTDQTPWAEQFLSWIGKDTTWRITYLDEVMVILQKNAGRGLTDDPQQIAPYADSLPSLLKLAHFFSVIEWQHSLKATLQAILLHDPDNCLALLNRALIAQNEADPMVSFFANQYQIRCQ